VNRAGGAPTRAAGTKLTGAAARANAVRAAACPANSPGSCRRAFPPPHAAVPGHPGGVDARSGACPAVVRPARGQGRRWWEPRRHSRGTPRPFNALHPPGPRLRTRGHALRDPSQDGFGKGALRQGRAGQEPVPARSLIDLESPATFPAMAGEPAREPAGRGSAGSPQASALIPGRAIAGDGPSRLLRRIANSATLAADRKRRGRTRSSRHTDRTGNLPAWPRGAEPPARHSCASCPAASARSPRLWAASRPHPGSVASTRGDSGLAGQPCHDIP